MAPERTSSRTKELGTVLHKHPLHFKTNVDSKKDLYPIEDTKMKSFASIVKKEAIN